MEFRFAKGLHDRDGDEYDSCLLAFVGKDVIIKFKDANELEEFAKKILNCLPEIRGEV